MRKQYAENGTGRWAAVSEENGKLVGGCGLKLIEEINSYRHVYNPGYRFNPEYWGKGYATETSEAVLKYAFNEMMLDKVYAYANVESTASNRV